MKLIFADPGRSSGFIWGEFTDDTPFTRHGYAQVEGGMTGLNHWLRDIWPTICDYRWYSEKFVPLTMPGMSHTLDSTYPLNVEGFLVARSLLPEWDIDQSRWQRAGMQYWVQSGTVAQKRRQQKAHIKAVQPDWYLTGKDVGYKDAEDVWSASFHVLTLLRGQRHLPTIKHFFPEEETE